MKSVPSPFRRTAVLAALALLSLGLSGCYYYDAGYCPPQRSYGYGYGPAHGYDAPRPHYGGYRSGYGGGYGYCPAY